MDTKSKDSSDEASPGTGNDNLRRRVHQIKALFTPGLTRDDWESTKELESLDQRRRSISQLELEKEQEKTGTTAAAGTSETKQTNAAGGDGGGGTDKKQKSGAPTLSRPKSVEVRPRPYPWAQWLNDVIDSSLWRLASLCALLVALFALDFNVAFLPKDVDDSTYIMIFVSFVFLCLELVLTCIAKENYLFSFFFWLDLIGTLSLLVDVPWLLGDVQEQSTDDLAVARASRVSRVARSAGSLRFARLFRIFRILRVARMFKLFGEKDRKEAHDTADRRPSKIGLRMVDLISKKVILLVLILILIIPFMDSTPVDNGEGKAVALIMLQQTTNQTDLDNNIDTFRDIYGSDLLFLKVQGFDHVPLKQDEVDDLRVSEILKTRTTPVFVNGTTSEAWFSIRDQMRLQALYHMGLILIIVVAFGVGAWVMSKDARVLVVEPIERMTTIVRKLAGHVFLLSAENDPAAADVLENEKYETAVIESLVEKMADIFRVAGDESRTVPLMGDAVFGPPMPMFEVDSEDDENDDGASSGSVSASGSDSSFTGSATEEELQAQIRKGVAGIDFAAHPELGTLEHVLNHPEAVKAFRKMLLADFSIENLLFWQAVEQYRRDIEVASQHIYDMYIRETASNRINIDPTLEQVIGASVEHGPWIGTFEDAQWEVFEAMQETYGSRFLQSSFVREYLKEKERKREHQQQLLRLRQHHAHDEKSLAEERRKSHK